MSDLANDIRCMSLAEAKYYFILFKGTVSSLERCDSMLSQQYNSGVIYHVLGQYTN